MLQHIPWRVILSVAVLLCLPTTLWADEAHGGERNPLDLIGLRADLGLWTLVVFGLLVVILWKFAWGPIMQGLQKREDIIRQAREDAVRARDEAEAIRVDLQRKMTAAHEEARSILEEARRDAATFRESERARTQADLQAERDRLRREIETARDQALQEIWSQAVQLASLMSTKAVGRHLSPDDHRQLLDEALADLGKQTNGTA